MSVEFPAHTALALGAARDVVDLAPDCFRAYDAMCRVHGVSNLHQATTAGPAALAGSLPAKLGAVAALPPGVREALGRERDLVGWVESLERAGAPADDRGEPSWSVLAHLVRETLFAQVFHRLYFLKEFLSVPVNDFWAAAGPVVADHRYRPVLEGLALPPQEAGRVLAEFAGRLDRTDLDFSAAPVFQVLAAQPAKSLEAWQFAWMHNDPTVRGFSLAIETSDPKTHPTLARALLETDPRSAFAMSVLIEHDWDGVKDKVPAWEKEVGDAPALLAALGRHYSRTKQYDEAQKALTRYVRQSPDAWAYEMIAANYKAKGDAARWKETLDDYLANVEDYGLDHARVRVQIADHFMEQKRWAEARPFAEAAAQTWAAWAMECAARCAEGSGDWDRAEFWIRQATERYAPSSWTAWYRFCKKSGHGDAKAAQAWTEDYLAGAVGRPDLAPPLVAGYFYWSIGSLKKARDSFARAIEANPSETMGIARPRARRRRAGRGGPARRAPDAALHPAQGPGAQDRGTRPGLPRLARRRRQGAGQPGSRGPGPHEPRARQPREPRVLRRPAPSDSRPDRSRPGLLEAQCRAHQRPTNGSGLSRPTSSADQGRMRSREPHAALGIGGRIPTIGLCRRRLR